LLRFKIQNSKQRTTDNGQRTTDKLKILQISSAHSFGGGEKHLVDLTKGLIERGHDVCVALRPHSPLIERLEGINVFTVPLRNSFDILSASQLKKIIRDNEIEIVHAHLGRDYPLASFAARNTKAKLIITRHVLFSLNRLHRFTLSNVTRVIAVSKAVEKNLLEQKIFPQEKICVVHNGINTDRKGEREKGRKGEEAKNTLVSPSPLLPFSPSPLLPFSTVGTVGELNQLKGHEEFIRAAALLVKKFDNIQFVIVGKDNSKKKENAKRFEKLCEDLNIKERVKFIDWIEPLKDFLSSLDVFVSASRSESFGLAILEAMNCGVPVVATKTEGACEIIENEKTGLLVEVGDVEAISDTVESLLNDELKRKAFSDAARRVVRERFSLGKMIDETEKVYQEAHSSSQTV
jgi:glycosyltransferase involved in cell wall biosynthesis